MNMPVVQSAVTVYGTKSLDAAEMQLQVNLIQDILHKVMKQGTHYGVIPGTKTNSLYKPGAEKIMATFRLAADPVVEDLSQGSEVHYRVKVRILNSAGDYLGAGVGECSSREEKYAWRAPVCDEEFDMTPEMLRRIKFKKWQGKVEQAKQIRTNPADMANTILKMAKKRGLVDAVLTVTAASDIFTQDIEDLPEELVEQIVGKSRDDSAKVDEWIGKINAATSRSELRAMASQLSVEKLSASGKAQVRAAWTAKQNTLPAEEAQQTPAEAVEGAE